MSIGTRSLLFGVHCFLIHPFFVAYAWYRLYGFPYDPRLWFAFFLHDVGYWGKPNMDGPEGERHVELGAAIVGRLFGAQWREFTLLHSRSYAKRLGRSPSRLCAADKLVVYYTPWWLYLPLARATGEIHEYMGQSAAAAVQTRVAGGNGEDLQPFKHNCPLRSWYAGLQQDLKQWADRYLASAAEEATQPPPAARLLPSGSGAKPQAAEAVARRTALASNNWHKASATSDELPLSRVLGFFCLPAMLALASEAAAQLMTRILVGNTLGSAGIAEITMAFPCSLLLLAFSLLFGCGAASAISVRLGEQRVQDAERILGTTLLLLSVTAAILTAAGLLLLDSVLALLGAGSPHGSAMRTYLQIMLGGAWFQLLSYGVTAVIRAVGRPWLATGIVLTGLTVNVAVSFGCTVGLGWGIAGVAVGATTAFAYMTALGLGFLISGRGAVGLRWNDLRFRWPMCASVLACGATPFLMQVATVVAGLLLNRQLQVYGGSAAVSTMGIIAAVTTAIILPTCGINVAVQSLIGFSYGARRFAGVLRMLRIAIGAATATTTLGFLLLMLFPRQILAAFGGDTHLTDLPGDISALRLSIIGLPLVGTQVVAVGYFQVIGKSALAAGLALGRQLLLMIPAIFILPCAAGLDGLWLAVPVVDFGMFLIAVYALAAERRRLLVPCTLKPMTVVAPRITMRPFRATRLGSRVLVSKRERCNVAAR